MFASLKNHPFAVEAFFEYSLVLTFAIPKQDIMPFIPKCLLPDTFNDKWAFIAVAMVQTKNLRPKGAPGFLGNNFFLIGNRVFVKYNSTNGKRLRGLYILKSQTNKRKMQFFGNIFTHSNYTTIDIEVIKKNNYLNIHSNKAGLSVTVELENELPALPIGSPFADWKEARRFAGPLPFTFTYNDDSKKVLIIEGVRSSWEPRPVKVLNHHIDFIKTLGFKEYHLANAFIIENVPYYWKKGKTEIWEP